MCAFFRSEEYFISIRQQHLQIARKKQITVKNLYELRFPLYFIRMVRWCRLKRVLELKHENSICECCKRASYRLYWQGCVNSVVNEHKEVQTMTSEWIRTHTRTLEPCHRLVSPSFGWMLGESFQENEMFLWLNYIDTFFYLFAIWRLSVSSRAALLVSATCNDELFGITRFTPDWLLLPCRAEEEKKNNLPRVRR